MTQSVSSQPFLGFWDDVASVFLPAQHLAPQPTQDADLLQQLNFIPGLKELLMLRQVHALEHATVWVLSAGRLPYASRATSAADNELLGGMSTDRGFYLYGQVNINELKCAVQTALQRITAGDWELAVHPRCGTNFSVGMLLTAGLALSASMLLPRGPIEQILGLGIAATAAAHLAPDVGNLAQRYITTAVPFNLAIERVTPIKDSLNRPAFFIQVRWID